MTGKSDFTEEEWKTFLEAPPRAGLLVIAYQLDDCDARVTRRTETR